jgi:cytochrome c553
MRRIPRLVLISSLALTASACAEPGAGLASDPAAPPAKLGLCSSCHGIDGISRTPGTPHIRGQDETYLRESLGQYRRGERKAGPMTAVAGTLSHDDIDALARHYAQIPWDKNQ